MFLHLVCQNTFLGWSKYIPSDVAPVDIAPLGIFHTSPVLHRFDTYQFYILGTLYLHPTNKIHWGI